MANQLGNDVASIQIARVVADEHSRMRRRPTLGIEQAEQCPFVRQHAVTVSAQRRHQIFVVIADGEVACAKFHCVNQWPPDAAVVVQAKVGREVDFHLDLPLAVSGSQPLNTFGQYNTLRYIV